MTTIKTKMGVAMMLATSFLFSNSALADWKMDASNSSISYGTIKNGAIGESNTFGTISGKISNNGDIKVEIDLRTVNTQIEIRDGRMRDIVYKVGVNPMATLSGNIDLTQFNEMAIGSIKIVETPLMLELVGEMIEIDSVLIAARLAENKVMIVPQNVLFIDADDFELTSAIEKLREIAGLDTIATVVPMSFYLTFEK